MKRQRTRPKPTSPRKGGSSTATAKRRARARRLERMDAPSNHAVPSIPSVATGDAERTYGTSEFRGIVRPFLLSPEMIEITFNRCRKSAGYHLKMLQQAFSTPGQLKGEDNGRPINVFIGGGLALSYGPGQSQPTVHARAEIAAPTIDVKPTNGNGHNGHNGGTNGKS